MPPLVHLEGRGKKPGHDVGICVDTMSYPAITANLVVLNSIDYVGMDL